MSITKWGVLIFLTATSLYGQVTADLSREIADVMSQAPSGKARQRFVHAKGIICTGTFQASAEARAISRAPHLMGSTSITVRFSDGAPDIAVSDTSPDASPRGMAIRFNVGRGTDIMAISHNGFVVGTGEDFLALQLAIARTDPAKPHPWPIETFLKSHAAARKFVEDPKPVPVSFATEPYFGNNAFLFVNAEGNTQAGRYQVLPVGGAEYLTEADARSKSPDFLREELALRLARHPAQFRLVVQLADPGDQTRDSSAIWPETRRTVELGLIRIDAIAENSAAADASLAFDPTRLIDGISLSDDPLPALRSSVYSYSVAGRRRSK